MKTQWLYFSLFWLLVALAGCGDGRTSDELRRVAEVVDDNPELALARLDSVELSALNSADRHYFDFLSIKAADKAYILHQSDSLIRSVIDYYEDRPDDELLPEVLYYGGRVYFDLGDAPQALHYFQQALDRVPASDLELRGRIVSQMGRLYKSQYLYSYAIDTFKESIKIDEQLQDTFGLTYDNSILASTYLAIEELDSAKKYYTKALNLSKGISSGDEALMKIYLAYVLTLQGEKEKALELVTVNLLNEIDYNAISIALIKSMYIYNSLGKHDLAGLIAKKALEYDNIELKKIAYGTLAEIDILTQNEDNLYNHLVLYKTMNDSLNTTISQEAVNYQNSYFNYSLRERDNHKLTKEKHTRDVIIIISFCVLIIALLFIRNRMAKAKSEKIEAVEAIRVLNLELSEKNRQISDLSGFLDESTAKKDEFTEKVYNLFSRQFQFLDKMGSTYYEAKNDVPDIKIIYKHVKNGIDAFCKENYAELEAYVNQYKDNVMARLRSEINLKEDDYRLLCYCLAGFSTKSISVFMGCSTTSISTRKWRLKSEIATQDPQIASFL